LSIDCGARAVLAALAALAGAAASGGCGFWFEDVTATPGIGPDAAPDALPGTPADACQFGRWTVQLGSRTFGDVNTLDTEWGVEASRDGMRVVFASNRPAPPIHQGTNYDLYMAERSAPDAVFGAAERLPISSDDSDDADPTLSDDALELYYVSDLGPRPCVYVSNRTDKSAGWGPPRRIDALCVTGQLGGPFLSSDGLRLYYDVVVSGDDAVLMMTTRADRKVDFAGAGAQVGPPGALRYCALDENELTAYCENTRGPKAQLWQATRSSTDAQFDAGRPITEFAEAGVFEDGDPSITRDGRQLIYASGRGPNGTSDLVLAERACQ
jgi:hypothetical protein